MGNVAFLSGHLPYANGELITGKVGDTVTPEDANAAARAVGMGLVTTLKHNLGDLDRVKRIVKLSVINGCSDFMFEVFEDKGVHARSAVGSNALPLNVCVEVEAIVEIE